MAKINAYLFSAIGKKVRDFSAANPEAKIIRLGIGDVTQPIAPAVIEALHGAVDEMGHAESFRGYAPDLGYEFLRDVIAREDFKARGCEISAEEIFISDGAKCDCGNIQEISRSATAAIYRRFLTHRTRLLCVIRSIRSMWIPM